MSGPESDAVYYGDRASDIVSLAQRTGNWQSVEEFRAKLANHAEADTSLKPLLQQLDDIVELAPIFRAIPKVTELAGDDPELKAFVVALTRIIDRRIQLGNSLRRQRSGLSGRKITAESVASARARSRAGTVADVARKLEVSRQKLSEWLSKNPEHDFRKKNKCHPRRGDR